MFVSHLWSVKAVSGKMKQPINLSNSRQFKYCIIYRTIRTVKRGLSCKITSTDDSGFGRTME